MLSAQLPPAQAFFTVSSSRPPMPARSPSQTRPGTLFVLPNSTAVGFYEYELGYSGYLRMEPAGAYDLIAIHSPSRA